MSRENPGVVFKRNYLPQWRLEGGIYFVTWRLHDQSDKLTSDERSIVAEAIKFFKDSRYRLNIFVVMDDHVHMLLQTLPGHDLSGILLSLKTYTATRINRLRGIAGKRWQKDSYTELMRNDAAIGSRRQYIYENPRRKWGIDPYIYQWVEWFEEGILPGGWTPPPQVGVDAGS